MKHWTSNFLMVPYKEMNCSEFVEMVQRIKFGREFEFPQSQGSIFNQSHQIKTSLPQFAEKTLSPVEGDLVLMHGIRRMCHVGVYVEIKGAQYVLHCEKRVTSSALHRFSDLMKFGYNVEGVYRWLE